MSSVQIPPLQALRQRAPIAPQSEAAAAHDTLESVSQSDTFTPAQRNFARSVNTATAQQSPQTALLIDTEAARLLQDDARPYDQLIAQLGTWVCSSPTLPDPKAQAGVANALLQDLAQQTSWARVANTARLSAAGSEPGPTSVRTFNQAFKTILAG